MPHSLQAVIHIGASSTRMLLAQAEENGAVETIDLLELPVPIARDIFRRSRLSRSTIETCAKVLRQFRHVLQEHQITELCRLRTVATNILAESENAETFYNRIHVACGLEVETLDDGEMTRLVYMSCERILRESPHLAKKNVLVFHIGPGNTRVLYLKNGRVVNYQSYRLGAFRIRESLESFQGSVEELRAMVHEHIYNQLEQIHHDLGDQKIHHIVALGAQIQSAAFVLAKQQATQKLLKLPLKKLDNFIQSLTQKSIDQLVRTFHTDYHTAESWVPALETNFSLAQTFDVKELLIPVFDFENALLYNLLQTGQNTFQPEVIQSAIAIGQKYHFDEPHALHVAQIASKIFRELKSAHQLDDKQELLLQVASLLHDIGHFISPRAHHKHSMYLIANSEVFGLSKREIQMIALIARYHRRAIPTLAHIEYRDLTRDHRMIVSKLAAILRIADALDCSHRQRVKEFQIISEPEELILQISSPKDITLKQMALNQKGDLFREIFGQNVVIRPYSSAYDFGK